MRVDAALNRARRLRRMKRGVVTAAELHRGEGAARTMMVTLTYRPGVQWRAEHISNALKHWRRELRGRALRYVWVMELTQRGVPHYHVLIWSDGARLGKPDESGAWPHGWSRIEWARNPVGYLVKYASKGTDRTLPRGARLFGVGGLSEPGRVQRRWWMLPRYIRQKVAAEDRVRRMEGGGWVALADGRWWTSECFYGGDDDQISGFFPVGTSRGYFEELFVAIDQEMTDWRVGEDGEVSCIVPERFRWP
jgi:hypothetical protein